MSKEYIEKEAVVKELNKEGYTKNMRVHKHILNIPPADVKPVVRGEWICTDDDRNVWQCTNCGEEQYIEAGTPEENEWYFCPHCGARMKGK